MSVAANAAEATAEVSLLIDVGSAWTKASVVGRTRGRWRIAASVAQPTAWGEEALEETLAARLAVGADQRLLDRLRELLAAAPRIGCRTPHRAGRLVIAAVAGEDEGVVGKRVEALGDGCNALLEVGGRLGAAGAAGEEDVAREEDAAREVTGAAGGVAGRVSGADRASADGDLFAV